MKYCKPKNLILTLSACTDCPYLKRIYGFYQFCNHPSLQHKDEKDKRIFVNTDKEFWKGCPIDNQE